MFGECLESVLLLHNFTALALGSWAVFIYEGIVTIIVPSSRHLNLEHRRLRRTRSRTPNKFIVYNTRVLGKSGCGLDNWLAVEAQLDRGLGDGTSSLSSEYGSDYNSRLGRLEK